MTECRRCGKPIGIEFSLCAECDRDLRPKVPTEDEINTIMIAAIKTQPPMTVYDELMALLAEKKDFAFIKVRRSLLEGITKEMATLSNDVETGKCLYNDLKDEVSCARHPDIV